MTKWNIYYSDDFKKAFKKLDKSTQKQIKKWIDNHLIDIEDPRFFGKPLFGNYHNLWRYRIGDYRLIVKIEDKKLIILMINIGHRSNVYK